MKETDLLWLELGSNVFFRRTGADLPVALLDRDVVATCC